MDKLLSKQKPLTEAAFAMLVDTLKSNPGGGDQLEELLREDNPIYDERGAAAIVRMRGWILLALAHLGLRDRALIFALEELDNGRDAYLVAAAARALRSHSRPETAFAPFLMQAITNIRYHDDSVCLDTYGAYDSRAGGPTSALAEVFETLRWLGPAAKEVLPDLEAMRKGSTGRVSSALTQELDRTLAVIRVAASMNGISAGHCCGAPAEFGNIRTWSSDFNSDVESAESIIFEDQDGVQVTFKDFFQHDPSIVVFFYTRCNNPQKCSLTIAKLARVQRLLVERQLSDRIRTAAITYDPAYDQPERLRGYGQSRDVRMNDRNKMLRATKGMSTLRDYFGLGVNFVESLVNRHRVEAYLVDAAGRVAASFERLQWVEQQLVDQAGTLLDDARLR